MLLGHALTMLHALYHIMLAYFVELSTTKTQQFDKKINI
jgi:hypothetical protein